MKKVILTIGLPASGKSTYAKELVETGNGSWRRVNRDELRWMLNNYKFTKKNEQFITKIRDQIIIDCLDDGKHVVIDETNLNPKNVEHLRVLLKGKAVVEINDSFLKTPLEECIKRDKKRANSVGKDVIMKMYNDYILPTVDTIPLVKRVEGLPDAIICDLDGTLCLMNNRGPYDVKKCITDDVNIAVSDHVKNYQNLGYKIIFLSGREDIAKAETELWFRNNGHAEYELLEMRKKGDPRKDSIVKREMYDEFVCGKYNIAHVLDDRNQVVELWRNLGLTCFQVAPSFD